MCAVYILPPNLDKLNKSRLESTKRRFQRAIDDFESEASALNYGIMKYLEDMDRLQNQITLTSYLPQKEKFRMQLEIIRTKKELDYARCCEVKSEIATLNYYLEEIDMASNRLIEAVELSD